MDYYSQIGQDRWVVETLKFKNNGTWLDIGSGLPIHINNTYFFEKNLNWSGVSIDLSDEETALWKETDRNLDWLVKTNALTVDYKILLKERGMPKVIDYLSMDLEPPLVTLEALFRVPFDEYQFRCITYETDAYRGFNTVTPSRDYLKSLGYTLVVSGIQDDFWVKQDLIN